MSSELPTANLPSEAPPVSGIALSTPAEHIFEYAAPATEVAPTSSSAADIAEAYEVASTLTKLRDGGYKKIALQFPDEMLRNASAVYDALQAGLPAEQSVYILADTSYSPCCVDLIAAAHVDADCVVHYGRACLTPLREGAGVEPIYIYTKQGVAIDEVVASAEKSLGKDSKIVLMADMPYQWALDSIAEKLRGSGYSVVTTDIVQDPNATIPNRRAIDCEDDLKEYDLFHIGEPPQSLVLVLSSRVKDIHISVPSSDDLAATTRRFMKRRYAALISAASASIIGVLIASPSSPMLPLLDSMTALIRNRKKKSYIFAMGKLNAAKLSNFLEIEAWVVIGCWNSSLVDGKVLGVEKAVLTPWELGVALEGEGRVWGDRWETDVRSLLEKKAEVEQEIEDGESAPPVFDFRTGRYVSSTVDSVPSLESSTSTDLAVRPKDDALARRDPLSVAKINNTPSPGAEFLNANRSWRGLGSDHKKIEIEYEEEGAELEEGRSGIARGYVVGDSEKR